MSKQRWGNYRLLARLPFTNERTLLRFTSTWLLKRNASPIQSLGGSGFVHYVRRRQLTSSHSLNHLNVGEQLAASILLSRPQDILLSATDSQSKDDLTKAICERLELPPPARLNSKYDDFGPYTNSYATLVAEETRCTIAAAMDKLFGKEATTTEPRGAVKIVIDVPPDRRSFPEYLECWTTSSLKPKDRSDLKAGSVVVLAPPGETDIEQFILGRLHHGSKASQPRR